MIDNYSHCENLMALSSGKLGSASAQYDTILLVEYSNIICFAKL